MIDAFVKKNVRLSLEFNEYVVTHDELLDQIPNRAYVVMILDGDEKFNTQSRSLIRDRRRKKIVEAHLTGSTWSIRPFQPA